MKKLFFIYIISFTSFSFFTIHGMKIVSGGLSDVTTFVVEEVEKLHKESKKHKTQSKNSSIR
jgi:hypothetical protein